MFEQSLQNYNATETDRTQRAIARDEDGFLVAAKRGDSAAFEMLCKQSASTVFHIARRMMRSKEDAEDVVQESFQMAFIHLKSFKGSSRFSTWLSRIAINAALMKLRRKRHLRDVPLDQSTETEEPSLRHDVEDQSPNPEELYAQTGTSMDSLRGHEWVDARNTKSNRAARAWRTIDRRDCSNHGNFRECGKGSSVSWAKEIARQTKESPRISIGRPKGRLHKWPITRETAHQIKRPAMRAVKAGSKRGSYDHAFTSHGIGDFDISLLHRPRCYRLETSTLNLVRPEQCSDPAISMSSEALAPGDEFALGL